MNIGIIDRGNMGRVWGNCGPASGIRSDSFAGNGTPERGAEGRIRGEGARGANEAPPGHLLRWLADRYIT